MPKDYALYRGEEFLTVGSAKDLAEYLGTGVNNIYCIFNRCSKRKTDNAYYVIEVPEDDDEE